MSSIIIDTNPLAYIYNADLDVLDHGTKLSEFLYIKNGREDC